MCGICGFYGFKDDALIDSMCELIKHRGPDQHGTYTDSFVSLGHRRLSIIDLSTNGRQPMANEDDTIQMVCNGEIYNFKELKSELETKGHRFISNSDSEVIIHSYEEFGEDCVTLFRGMFAFAIWDLKQHKLILARDRLGIKPLYYMLHRSKLYFASEIKTMLIDKSFKRRINEDAYDLFMAFQYIPNEQTMFKDIYKLSPGSLLVFEGNAIDIKKYWEPHSINNELRFNDKKQATKRVKEVLEESINLTLVSDVPIGVLLSGGLDSSSIVGIINTLKPDHKIKTFSVGFGEPNDELQFSRIVANRFNTENHEIILKPSNLVSVLSNIIWHMDEPMADGGSIATFLAAQIIKDYVKVVLVGEGADELFAGYNWHKISTPYLKFLPRTIKLRLYFYLNTFYRQKKYKSILSDNSVYQRFALKFKESAGKNKISDVLKEMSLYEILTMLPNHLLMKVDKMTMAHSIEARVPFLDHKLTELALSLPPKYKLKGNVGKYILRKAMSNILPQEILSRKKQGFILPFNKWLRHDIKDYVLSVLLNSSSHTLSMFKKHEIINLFKNPLNRFEEIENTNLIWRLFVFELWHNMYLKSESF